ncbi:MAG: DUF6356 family protein [Myxococcota bacterium]
MRSPIPTPFASAWVAWFQAHPRQVGESYGEHWWAAARIGGRLIRAGLACWLHAWVPAWCTRTASCEVQGLAREMAARGGGAGLDSAGRGEGG